MRQFPKDDADNKDLQILNADQWQIDLLKLNPSYVWWGCLEDYMSKKEGWDGALTFPNIKDGGLFGLDELNECVNFYFQIYRKSHECPHCEGSAKNKATKQLSDDWYDFAETGRRWDKKLTEIEVEALVKHGRIGGVSNFHGHFDEERNTWVKWADGAKVDCEKPEMPTPQKVNQWAGGRGIGHDAINQWVCVEARAKHLGIWGTCEHCEGGQIYDEPTAKVALQLWYLHPRKGCSRGVYIEEITKEDLSTVFAHLKEAKERNNERFSKIM